MDELTQVVLQLLDCTEALEKRLRLYEATLRFVRSNNATAASSFDADMELVRSTPGLVGECVSPELDRLGEIVRQLVVQIAQDSEKNSKP